MAREIAVGVAGCAVGVAAAALLLLRRRQLTAEAAIQHEPPSRRSRRACATTTAPDGLCHRGWPSGVVSVGISRTVHCVDALAWLRQQGGALPKTWCVITSLPDVCEVQPSSTVPHVAPSASQVVGSHGGTSHTFGVPSPAHTAGAVQVPQSSTSPHPSEA